MSAPLTNRGLLRALLLAFVLLLAYRFLATVAAVTMLLLTGLLLAVALSAGRGAPPAESPAAGRRRRLVLAGLGLVGYLHFPTLIAQVEQLVTSLPDAFSRLVAL